VKQTALLHISGTVLAGLGVLTDGTLRIALFALAVVAFVAGIVIARRDDDGPPTAGDLS
jgi:uncharacterized membrane protein YoaK (UPF0700 family)